VRYFRTASTLHHRDERELISATARSYLFVPANRPDRFAKALSSGADAVVVDLEDAVPPAEKEPARDRLAAWLCNDHPVVVRINGVETPWFRDDLLLATLPGVSGIMLPKAERIDADLTAACAGAGVPLLPMIESAAGLANSQAIACATSVQRLVFGTIDFQLDLGLAAEHSDLLPYSAQLVMASRRAGIGAPVDGVNTTLYDGDALRADTLRCRRFGFGGKLCIHPRQVAIVNACFQPSAAEQAWAREVLQAAARAGGAALAIDGQMVDRPVMMRARAILQEAARNSSAGGRPTQSGEGDE